MPAQPSLSIQNSSGHADASLAACRYVIADRAQDAGLIAQCRREPRWQLDYSDDETLIYANSDNLDSRRAS